MKTLETVNGQKVWAVDDAYCQGCIFYNEMCDGIECTKNSRPDKRNVIFLPYEEKKEKIFTLSQINEVIYELIKSESYSHSISLNKLKQKLEQL